MKSAAKLATAIGIAGIMTVAVAMPAQAAPWDENDVEFGLGLWNYDNNYVSMTDVDLLVAPDTYEYTDIWDEMGETYIDSASAVLDFEGVVCDPSDTVDVSVEAATGDLLYTCVSSNPAFAAAGLTVTSEIRVYATSDLVRVATTIANANAAAVAIDEIEVYTDFGSSGQIWGYQGQSDAILPVPATEDSASSNAIRDAGAQWAVHFEEYDAPGGVAWGAAGAQAPANLNYIDGDSYSASVSAFSIPAGESRSVAYFALWNPATLIELGYTNEEASDIQVDAASALVPSMAEFNTFSGRLTAGLTVANVVNWSPAAAVPAPEPEAAKLPATGSETPVAGIAGIAGLLALIGAGVLVISRRRTAAN